MKAAGYHTAWLSYQEVTGIYGKVPRAYADRCNEKKFTTIHDTETTVYEFDEKLLPLLDDSLKANALLDLIRAKVCSAKTSTARAGEFTRTTSTRTAK